MTTTTEPLILDRANLATHTMAAKERTRYAFHGVHLDPIGTVATDGKALIRVPYASGQPNGSEGAILDSKALKCLLASMRATKADRVELSGSHEDKTLRALTIGIDSQLPNTEGNFPAVASVIPKTEPTATIAFDASIMARTCKALCDVAANRFSKDKRPTVKMELHGPDQAIVLTLRMDGQDTIALVMPVTLRGA